MDRKLLFNLCINYPHSGISMFQADRYNIHKANDNQSPVNHKNKNLHWNHAAIYNNTGIPDDQPAIVCTVV